MLKKKIAKKIISLLIVITLLINIIPNFSLLKVSYAATTSNIVLKKGNYDATNKVLAIELYIRDITFYALELTFAYPSTDMEFIDYEEYENSKTITKVSRATYAIKDNKSVTGAGIDTTSSIDTAQGSMHICMGTLYGDSEDPYDSTGAETLIATMYLHVTNDSFNISSLTADMFNLVSGEYFSFIDGDGEEDIYDESMFGVEGFEPVSNEVTGISITNLPTKSVYNVGDTVDLTGMTVKTTYSDGTDSGDVDIATLSSDYTITKPTLTTPGTAEIKVEYKGSNATAGLTPATENILVLPTGLTAIYGQKLSTITLPADFEWENPNTLVGNVGDNTHTVKYTGSDFNGTKTGLSVTVNVEKKVVTRISVTTEPTKTDYIEGQNLDLTGMVVTATYNDGSSEATTDYTTDPVNATKLTKVGTETITVKYTGNDASETLGTTTTTVNVAAREISSIEITNAPTKVDYVEGQKFIPTGMEITVTYNDGTTSTIDSDYEAAGVTFTPSTATALQTTNTNIVVTYRGKTADQAITVEAKVVVSISATQPTKVDYIEGQNLNLSGMVVTATYNDGTSEVTADYTTNPVNGTKLTTVGTETITIEYTGNDASATLKTTTTTVNVEKKVVVSISATQPTKVDYIEGQNLNLSGMVVTATYNDGDSKEVTTYTTSPADGTKLTTVGTETIKVKYTGSDASASLKATTTTVNVEKKVVVSISATQPSKKDYVEGQNLNLSGMVVTATYNDGDSKEVTTYTTSPANGTALMTVGTETITITYSGADINGTAPTATTTVDVAAREVSSIAITTAPAKVDYVEGQVFDPTGMKITVTYNDGGTAVIDGDYETAGVTFVPSTTTALQTTDTNIVITYEGKIANQAITVAKKVVSSITVKTEPTKAEYVEGQNLDLTGIIIEATYNDGTTAETTSYTTNPANGAALTTVGTETITITYSGADINGTAPSTTTNVNVVKKIVSSIAVKTEPTKTEYVEGQNLDLTGIIIEATYNDGTTAETTSYTTNPVDGAKLTTVGTETITITYSGADISGTAPSTTTNVNVIKKVVSSIAVKTEPTKTEYVEGQNLDLTGMIVTATYNDGTTAETTSYTTNPANGAALTTVGTETITITYSGADINGTAPSTTTSVNVIERVVSSIAITTEATKTEYVEGQVFDPTGMKITVTYNDGETAVIDNDYEAAGVTFVPSTTTALQTTDTNVVVSYRGKTANQAITVEAKVVVSISATQPTKVNYIEGQNLDLTGMIVTATYNDGTSEETADYTTNPANGTVLGTVGTETITVEYTGSDAGASLETTTITVNVEKRVVVSISATQPTKADYIEGQNLDLTGMVVTATYNDGTSEETTDYTTNPVDGAKLTTVGTETITIEYTGSDASATLKTTTTTVNVEKKVVVSISATQPTKVDYIEGQNLDLTGMVVTATYNDETTAETTGYTTNPANGTKLTTVGTEIITIKYTGNDASASLETTTTTVNIAAREVSSIAITTAPAKTEYVEGQVFDPTGMKVTVTYNDGGTAVIDGDYETAGVTFTPSTATALQTTNTNIVVSYRGKTADQAITVEAKVVVSISATEPTKVDYIEGQNLDLTGMVVTATYNDGTSEATTDYTTNPVNGAALTTVGTETITITYSGADINGTAPSTTTNVNVVKKIVSSIAVKTEPTKTEYVEGQNLDLTGIIIEATYNDGTTAETTSYTTNPVDGAKLTTVGTETITITYSGADISGTAPSTTTNVNVIKKVVSSIAVKTEPTKTEYVEGQNLDLTGMIVTATYNDGTTAEITNYTTNPANGTALMTVGTETITITYSGADINGTAPSTTTSVNVVERIVSSIVITTEPTKTEYVEGQVFDPTGMKITVTYNDGGTAVIDGDYETAGVTFTPSTITALQTSDTNIVVSYRGKTADQSITVEAKVVVSISATQPTKADYVEGQNLDLTGMVVTATYNDGTTAETTDYITNPANGTLLGTVGTETITVEYTGSDASVSLRTTTTTVNVEKKVVVSISATEPTKVDYIEGQNLDLTGMVVTATYNDGDSKEVSTYTTTPANGTKLTTVGTETITIKYTGSDASVSLRTTTTTVNVEKKVVVSISATQPTKVDYIEGQNLDLTGMVVTATYNDGTSEATTDYTTNPANGYTLLIPGTQIVTVKYTGSDASATLGTTTTTVNVAERVVSSIAITTAPLKVDYIEGQVFDPAGMKITVTYNDGGTAVIDGDYETAGVTFTPSTTTALQTSDTNVVVSYRGKTATQTITVIPDYVTDISVQAPSKLTYKYGEAIDLTGATITKVWASGIAHSNDTIAVTKDMLSNIDISSFDNMNTLGTKEITVTYGSIVKANAFQVTINDYIDSISIVDKAILEKDYIFGDTIDVSGGKINVNWKSGRAEVKDIETNMISVNNMNVEDGKIVTVTYEGKTDTFIINVKDVVMGIDITTVPTKRVYKLNEAASFSDIVVKNIMKSGATGSILTTSEYTITGFNSSVVGEKTITVTKIGTTFTDSFMIKVIDATTDMAITALPKQTYKYGETLDLTNGEITITKQTGSQVISMKDSAVSVTGYNSNKLGNQTLTVTYTYQEETENGIETKTMIDTFTVTVEDYWNGKIMITALPEKLKYKYGEDIELTGGKVAKILASGAKEDEVEITGEMISGYDKNKVGTQIITVTYLEKTATFSVTVIDETEGISMATNPNKTEYKKGESLDLTGGTINVIKTSGIKVIPITKEMISGYDPNKIGTQLITVSYDGKTTQFVVTVKPATNKPTNNKPSNSINETTYTVTFMNYDGTIIKTEKVVKGSSATAPEVALRKGYKFLGWDKNFETVEEDMTIMARYEEIKKAQVNTKEDITIEQGKDLDLSDITLEIFDDEGNTIDEIPVTEDMISGFNPEKVGTQTVTVKYTDENGIEYTATFKVKVIRKTETLGVKVESDTKEDNLKDIILPTTIGAGTAGLLLLLIAWVTRKNVEIYALTENERKLVGKQKITKNERRIVLDKYEKELENANIEVVLNKNITKKLDEEMVDIVFKGKKSTYKVKAEDNKEFDIKMRNM